MEVESKTKLYEVHNKLLELKEVVASLDNDYRSKRAVKLVNESIELISQTLIIKGGRMCDGSCASGLSNITIAEILSRKYLHW